MHARVHITNKKVNAANSNNDTLLLLPLNEAAAAAGGSRRATPLLDTSPGERLCLLQD